MKPRASFDVCNDLSQDLLSVGGFLASLKPGALLWGGVPCVAYVWLNRCLSLIPISPCPPTYPFVLAVEYATDH